MATAVCRQIKRQYPDSQLVVVSGYPEVFLDNPHVDRAFGFGQTNYFYQDYIENKDFKFLGHDPYLEAGHLMQTEHLTHTWCKMFGFDVPESTNPELFLTDREKTFFGKKFVSDRPILLLQTNGGAQGQELKYSWARDIPFHISAEIVKTLSPKYHIIQVCRSKDQAIPGTEVVSESMSNMELLSLLLFSERRILIDSCLQHAASALGLKSKVLWVSTSPEVFGYSLHENIKAEIPEEVKLPDSYLFDYNFHGLNHECPIKDLNIFDASSIVNSILSEG
jgi:hypothetical protein